jgi:ribose transport system permease protein
MVEVVVVAIFQALSPDGAFLNEANLRGMALTASQVLMLTIGQAVLMSAGHIDISQGAVAILASVIAGMVTNSTQDVLGHTWAIVLGLGVALICGALIGIINGIFTAVVGINSLVTTLGMLSLATGTAQVVTGGVNLYGMPGELQTGFGSIHFGALPLPLLVSGTLVAVIWAVYRLHPWGTHILAMGSNLVAAHRVGIRTVRNTIMVFVLSSTLAGMVGFIDLARYSTTNISGHLNDAMAAIAGALIGGTALIGGKINFLGAIVGASLAIILQSGLVIIDVSPFYQTIVIGFMLLVAVSLDPSNRRALTGRG